MQRRVVLTSFLWMAISTSGCSALARPVGQPSFTLSAEQLQQAVTKRFPQRFPVAGLVDLLVEAPRLRLLPETNRLGVEMAVRAGGPMLKRSYSGAFDLDFGLRYEASDQSIRAHQLHVNSLRFDDLQPRQAELLNTYGPALANQALQEIVLHQLRPQDLAVPQSMGLEPGSISVTAKGLVIGFVRPRLPTAP